jgi:hypothetical protein
MLPVAITGGRRPPLQDGDERKRDPASLGMCPLLYRSTGADLGDNRSFARAISRTIVVSLPKEFTR